MTSRPRIRTLSFLLTALVATTTMLASIPAASAGPVDTVEDAVFDAYKDTRNIADDAVDTATSDVVESSFECHRPDHPFGGSLLPFEVCVGTHYHDCNVIVKALFLVCV